MKPCNQPKQRFIDCRPALRVLRLLCPLVALLQGAVAFGQAHTRDLASKAQYLQYIDPLVKVKDFGMSYYEDGAADASVLFPRNSDNPYDKPRDPVIALVRLGAKSFPLLIDCLDDRRVTTVRFEGNNITRPMNVPVGYVCLDILMAITWGKPVADPDCSADGLGACMNHGFYFRPDDYSNCWPRECLLRPWVKVVQRNWRREYLRGHLRFHNPYDDLGVEEYKEFRSKKQNPGP